MKKLILSLALVLALVPAIAMRFDAQQTQPGAWTYNHNGHSFLLASDQTFSADTSLHNINGLALPMPNIGSATTLVVECRLWVSQATAAVANIYGIQFATTGPTNSMWYEQAQTSVAATGVYAATAPAAVTGTSATTITTATPGAISTIYGVILHGVVQWPANTTGTLNIQAGTGNTSDVLTVKALSMCYFPSF